MYYIRLLKEPHVNTQAKQKPKTSKRNDDTSQDHKPCLVTLITVTTDLGESFYPYDVELTVRAAFDENAQDRHLSNNGNTLTKKRRSDQLQDASYFQSRTTVVKVQWRAGMREQRVLVPIPAPLDTSKAFVFNMTAATTIKHPAIVNDRGCMIMPSVMAIEAIRERDTYGSWGTSYWRQIPLAGLSTSSSHGSDSNDGTEFQHEDEPQLRILEAPPNAITAIERHIWDAGTAATAFLPHILSASVSSSTEGVSAALPSLAKIMQDAMYPNEPFSGAFRIIELGCGCAPLSAALVTFILASNAHVPPIPPKHRSRPREFDIILTDMRAAEETSSINVRRAKELGTERALKAKARYDSPRVTTSFLHLAWENVTASSRLGPQQALPERLQGKTMDLIMASDVTYNPRTSPALVKTISTLYDASVQSTERAIQKRAEVQEPLVMIARKFRHREEEVFWDEMRFAGFKVRESCRIWCPAIEAAEVRGDEGEWVEVHTFDRG